MGSGVTHVQGVAGGSAGQSLATVTLSAPTTAGNMLVVGFAFGTTSFSSISDDRGNAYVQIGSQVLTPGGARTRLYYAKNISGGAVTITVRLTGTAPYLEVYAMEYQGADPTNPLEATAQASGTGTSVTSGNLVTATANDLLFAYCSADSQCSVGGGFTARSTYQSNLIEDRIVGSPGSYAATATATAGWAMLAAAFKPASSLSSAPVASVTVTPSSSSVQVGATQAFTAVTRDASGNVLTDRSVSWSTGDATVATVSQAGVVTGVAAGGPVAVTATSEGQTGQATVTVSSSPPPPPSGGYAYPLVVGPTGRNLVDQTGRPFFLVGDAGWSLVAQPTMQQAETYLSSRQQLGFNLIMVSLIEHKFSTNAPANIYGIAPFTGQTFTTPNEAYFAHADSVIQSAAAKGIVVLLGPDYLGYNCGNEGWCVETQAATTAQMFTWGQWVGNRYKNYDNIIWNIGGDVDPRTPATVSSKLQAMVNGILSVDTRHPFTAHNDAGQMAIEPWSGASWLNVNNTYTSFGSPDYVEAREAYNVSPTMPFFLAESRYDGEGPNAQQLRYQSYGTALSGAFGHIYGNCPIWHFSAPSGQSFCPGASSWQSQLNNQGAMNMRFFRALFESRNWDKLLPDETHTAVTAGYGTFGQTDYLTAARASDGSSIIAYMPTSRTVTVNGSSLAGSSMTAWWFNPATGVATSIGTYSTSSPRSLTPPSSGDWVLVLDGSAFSFGAPGTGAVTPPTVTAITVAPASATVDAEQTRQFAAGAIMSDGATQANPTVVWTATGGTITSSGLYSAGSTAGAFRVVATSPAGPADTAEVTVTVPPPQPPPPGAVTNLSVVSSTSTSATLRFTEVDDGTGHPATYDIRRAAPPISFSSATPVSSGSCATPVAGTTVGNLRTCTVLGLSPATTYEFQLVAFRGSLDSNPVFGPLSNVAAVSTTAVPVATVTVSPPSGTVTAGQTLQLTATTRDASGGVLTGRPVTWTTSNAAIATVSSSGLVSGVAAGGPVTVTATSEGVSGTSSITVIAVPTAITFVQATATSTTGSTRTLTLPAPSAPGNLIVVGFVFGSTSFVSITDNRGNAYAQVGSQITTPAGWRTRLYYAKNVAGGATTITVRFQASTTIEVYAAEYNGASTSNPLDATVQRSGTSGNVTSGNLVTTSPNELLLAMCIGDWRCSAGSGFTARSTYNSNLLEDRSVATAGSYAATATADAGWAIIAAAFRR